MIQHARTNADHDHRAALEPGSQALLVMPRGPANWGGAAAMWVTVAGWSGALRRLGAEPIILTPNGRKSEDECLTSSLPPVTMASRSRWLQLAPRAPKQVVRDLQFAGTMRGYARSLPVEVAGMSLVPQLVWQHHEMFHTAGAAVARRHGVPIIEYVHAPVVWEAQRWGIRRRGWARALEHLGERPQLSHADVVACVSNEVLGAVIDLGASEDRCIVAPMGVDPDRFSPAVDGSAWRTRFEALGEFIVTWVGSFRSFHSLDLLVSAAAALRQQGLAIGLVLVGDGQDRPRVEDRVAQAGLGPHVVFVGQVPNEQVPAILSASDAAAVTASADQDFHYSPLKLREYMAMQLPVVGPAVGDVARIIDDGDTGLLYEPGDAEAMAIALAQLANDPALRQAVGERARARVLASCTWDAIVNSTLARLR